MTRNVLKLMAIGCGIGLFAIGVNNFVSNREYINGAYHSVTRADGYKGCTELIMYHNGDYKEDRVIQHKCIGPSKYIYDGGLDGQNDGLVDRIYIPGSAFTSFTGELTREHDYVRFKKEFDDADKLLADTKKRFEKYFY